MAISISARNRFKLNLLASVAVGLAFMPATGWAASCSSKPALVTPEASVQAVNVTAGMISERVSSSAASGNDVTITPTANVGVTDPCAPVPVVLNVTESATPDAAQVKTRNSIWSAASYNGIRRNDLGGDYHGGVTNAVVGYDRLITSNLVVGLALGFENVDIITGYDSGTLKSNSGTIAPYIGVILTDWLVLDASVGYTGIGYDFMRTSNGAKITGKTDASRFFGSADLTATQHYGRIKMFGQLGYLELSETQKYYIETDNTSHSTNTIYFGQVHATVGAGYDFLADFGKITPTISVRYEYDTVQPGAVFLGNGVYSSSKPDGVVFGFGVDVKTHDDLSFGVKGTTTQFRDHTDAFSVAGNIKYRF